MFELFGTSGKDGAAWDRAVGLMPYDCQDVQVQRRWYAAHEGPGVTALLGVYTDTKRNYQTLQPFLLRNISGTAFCDITAPGYGGPFTSDAVPSRRHGEAFAEAFGTALERLKVVSEFWLENPIFAQHQALLYFGGEAHYERSVSLVPVGTPDEVLSRMRPNRRQSLDKAKGAEIGMATPAEFMELYEAAMERKHAAPRWRHVPEQLLQPDDNGSRPRYVLLKATRPGDAKPAAVALFVLGNVAAYYHLSATQDPALSGYADALIFEGISWARARGLMFMSLGGGLQDDDSLSAYKRSWGGLQRPLYSYRYVINLDIYDALSMGRTTTFFPAYRSEESK